MLRSCILSKFYIKPQLGIKFVTLYRRCILSKFYIKPQPLLTYFTQYPVVSYRNSTSNHNFPFFLNSFSKLYLIEILHQTTTGVFGRPSEFQLYLIEILHQTTTYSVSKAFSSSLYLIEILHQTTTKLHRRCEGLRCILSKFYIKPQRVGELFERIDVVSYRNSTSNHNRSRSGLPMRWLYLIEILHQTTTMPASPFRRTGLYLIEILHQTTTFPLSVR